MSDDLVWRQYGKIIFVFLLYNNILKCLLLSSVNLFLYRLEISRM